MQEPGEADEREGSEARPESWLGYGWYLVKKAGNGTYSGEKYSNCFTLRYALSAVKWLIIWGESWPTSLE